MSASQRQQRFSETTIVGLLVLSMAVVALYSTLRYGGLWGEADTSSRTGDILSVLRAGQIVPETGEVYPNGYGFQVIVTFLVNLTGLSVADIQLYGSGLMAIWIVIPAWLAYRELTGSSKGALLATLFLLIQPEFLFVILRGTHEKFTRGLMFLCLYLLARSLSPHQIFGRKSGYVLAFYLCGFAIIALNNLIGSSFIFALALALIMVWISIKVRPAPQHSFEVVPRRLALVLISFLILYFVVTFYIYPPAQHDLFFVKDFTEQTATMVADVEEHSVNPYQIVNTGWVNLPIYFAVSIANWLLLLSSITVWLWLTVGWLRHRWQPQTRSALLLWALFAAFALQGALSIVVDLSGAVGGTLQHRLFPSFVMIAAPMLSMPLARWRMRPSGAGRMAYSGLSAGFAALALLSLFKATNEPLLSNKWLFYTPGEMQAIVWSSQSLTDRYIWTETDERISTAVNIRTEGGSLTDYLDRGLPSVATRDFLLSEVTRSRAARMGAILPVEGDNFITYDNGEAQMYHLRPQTEYQR